MAAGIAQKSCTALFPLWSLSKNDIPKMKKKKTKQKKKNKEAGMTQSIMQSNLNVSFGKNEKGHKN